RRGVGYRRLAEVHVEQDGNVIGRRREVRVDGERAREGPDEELVSPLGVHSIDLGLAERAVLAGVDDGRAEISQVVDRFVYYVDGLAVVHREEILVHVLAYDADAN